jgi:hypothetical protein
MKPTEPAPAHGDCGPAQPHDDFHNIGVEHETSDVNVRVILSLAGVIAAVAIACAVIVWGLFNLMERQAAARDPKLSPLAMPATNMSRPGSVSPTFGNARSPQLETDELQMLRIQRESEDKKLHGYGWTDEKAGVAWVPIDQAKKLLAERGLPARAAGSAPAEGTHAPALGESSSGRRIPADGQPAAKPPSGGAAATPPASETPKAPAPAAAGHGSGH